MQGTPLLLLKLHSGSSPVILYPHFVIVHYCLLTHLQARLWISPCFQGPIHQYCWFVINVYCRLELFPISCWIHIFFPTEILSDCFLEKKLFLMLLNNFWFYWKNIYLQGLSTFIFFAGVGPWCVSLLVIIYICAVTHF